MKCHIFHIAEKSKKSCGKVEEFLMPGPNLIVLIALERHYERNNGSNDGSNGCNVVGGEVPVHRGEKIGRCRVIHKRRT